MRSTTPTSRRAAATALDATVERLARRKDAWVRVGPADRVAYLTRCLQRLVEIAPSWVREACLRRGIDPGSALSGEEWLSGPMVTAQAIRQFNHSLGRDGRPRACGIRVTDAGQTVVRVFPDNLTERLLYYNMSAEIWIQPGREASQGRIYREKSAGRYPPGKVALVLGAGNISSIGPLDALHKLLVEDEVVVLKTNPVNAYLAPYLEYAFEPVMRDGFLGICGGGPEIGDYLCRHPLVDSIHLTGSARTYDAIVWGSDRNAHPARKAEGRRALSKPVTAELGCVTPVLVVPGRWSSADLEFQARHVAAMVTHNAGFNCNAAQVVVLARGWAQREEFVDRLKAALARIPPRRAYYPGAQERHRGFEAHYPAAMPVGERNEGSVPWTFIPDVPPKGDEYALSQEAFCGLLSEVSIDASSAVDFLLRAVDFVNGAVWGSLSCALIVDSATAREHAAAVDGAIERLEYGGVGLNVWPGIVYGLGVTSWGAFPGHTAERIGSGQGAVHNTLLFDHPQKSVVRAPFRIRPKPIWFPDHRTLDRLGRRLLHFQLGRSPAQLAALAWTGLRG